MVKTNWITQKIHSDTILKLPRVTSFTLINKGDSRIFFREEEIAPNEIYVLEGDGSISNIELDIRFENGKGKAVLNYRSVINC